MEFGHLMTDILVYASCKFEMYIFKIAIVISENIGIAFLYVLSIFLKYTGFVYRLKHFGMNIRVYYNGTESDLVLHCLPRPTDIKFTNEFVFDRN